MRRRTSTPTKKRKTKEQKKKFSQFHVRDKCEKSKFEGRIGFQGTHSIVFNFILFLKNPKYFLYPKYLVLRYQSVKRNCRLIA